MPTYLILAKELADLDAAFEQFDGLDETASPAEANRSAISLVGGELLDMYYTVGEYNAALVVEFPDQETLMRAQQQARDLGITDLTVLDAVHYEDVTEMVAN